jgi:hypothetical protein
MSSGSNSLHSDLLDYSLECSWFDACICCLP